MQHKKLENLQSEFMHKIRTLAPQKLQEVYKFVAVVVNEKCKIVVHADDLHRLPKNLQMTKLREKIDLDQQMLTARNHLINSLQKTEQENRSKLDKRNCQVGEKDTLISQVNNELASKEEELRKLFGILNFKQREMRRQEHVIQLLWR
ncbi:hypothetical protein M5D96_014079 [Drosophila gunungcola]|uniref:Uncharacterized protein n=1 Tax=Drosophila gunungcola TaxID=103775 RepID=A0A9P9YAV8_9MUSC|nr:hypothetical protein M5D96_014079 [Drosophila gunungcola]